MDFEFDKQIDAILRGVAKEPNFVNQPTEHLDADHISAFAENVLPANARLNAISHLADCNRCRTILTNVVKLNTEAENEIVHASSMPTVETKQLSWFEKLFTLPNLAYSMGGLILVFAGFIGFSVLQNNKTADVARIDKPESIQSKGVSGASSEGDALPKETYNSNSTSSAANTATPATNAVANSSMPIANASTSTNSIALNQKNVASNSSANTNSIKQPAPEPVGRDAGKTNETGAKPLKEEADKKDISVSDVQPPKPSATPITDALKTEDSAPTSENKTNPDDEAERTRGANVPKPKKIENKEKLNSQIAPSTMAKSSNDQKSAASSNNKTVSGKTFRNVKGIWTDSAYTGGSTKKVKRGSNEYKKLDQGLQNIGKTLGGTVIVVWSGKNYKIQ